MIGFDDVTPFRAEADQAVGSAITIPTRFARTVFRNSAFGLVGQMVMKILSFGFSVLIVRHLGVQAYGQYAAVLAFGAVFVFLGDLGLSPYTVREVARLRDTAGGLSQIECLYSNVLVLRLVLSLLTAILLISAAWLTGRPLVMLGAIALGAIGLIIYGPEGASEAVLSGFERLDLSATAKVLQQLVFVVIGALLLWLRVGYYGLILANLLGVIVLTYVCWSRVRGLGVRIDRLNPRSWPTLLRASVPFGIIGFALGLSYKFDSVLLNVFRGDAETGYYNAAYNLIFSAVVISNVVNAALYPSLSRHSTSAADSLQGIYQRCLRYLLLLSLPIAVGGWALAGRIVPFLFTGAYINSVLALQILIWVVPFMFASEFFGYIVLIQGKEREVARAVLVSSGFNILMNFLLVPRFGILGASVMTVITEIILVGQYVWLLRVLLRQINLLKLLGKPLLALLMMGSWLVMAPADISLPTRVAGAAVAYMAGLVVLKAIGREELAFVLSVVSRQRTVSENVVVSTPPTSETL